MSKKNPPSSRSPQDPIWRAYLEGAVGFSVTPRLVKAASLSPKARTRGREIDGNLLERLRKGQLPLEARLDLHGLTLDRAHERVKKFIRQAHAQHLRCILVITGKGPYNPVQGSETKGLLRNALPEWLEMEPLKSIVLRCVPAIQAHGGLGAYYILLRRVRE